MSGVLTILLLWASSIWYFDWTISEWRQDWLWILLLINRLTLCWRSSTIMIICWPPSILNRWQGIAISNDHTVIVWKHLLMRLPYVLLLHSRMRRRLWLRNPNSSLAFSTLNFRRMLSIFGITRRSHVLTMMMSWCRNTVVRNIAMGVSTAARSHWWINSVSVTWHLLWSWSWSCWWRHLV